MCFDGKIRKIFFFFFFFFFFFVFLAGAMLISGYTYTVFSTMDFSDHLSQKAKMTDDDYN